MYNICINKYITMCISYIQWYMTICNIYW